MPSSPEPAPDRTAELLDLALETASMAVWEWDVRSGRIHQRGPGALDLGYGPGVAPQTVEAWLPHVHASDRELAGEVVGRCLFEGGEQFLVRVRVRDSSGHYRWLQVSGRVAARDETRAPIRFIGTTQDVHHLQAEAAPGGSEAHELLARDARILSQLRDLVVCLDLNGHVTYWNDAAERILGWKREEILGKHVSARVPVAYAEQLKLGLSQLFEGKTPPPGEWQDVRKDGSPVWILWRTELLRDRDGKAFAVTAIGTDVTDRRSAEEQRRKLETQLFHAQKLESLGTMVGGVAHDFNNTLAIVLVYAEVALARRAELPLDVSEALRQIHLAGGRARELVTRLLTFGRLQKADRGVVDLGILLRDYSKLLRATLPSSIALEVDAPESISVLADENQIHQVLLNLSTNAAQAMNDRGHLRLRLSRERIDVGAARPELGLSSGAFATMSVEDDGVGISAETLPHIFEPFFTTKPVGEGTGLGLATALAIVKGHGGAIDVESSVGVGSRFTVYLPLGSERAVEPRTPEPPIVGHGQRVLVVDDEDAVATLTRTALEALGYRAECVFSPEQFLERYLAEPETWQLLVIDQTMPRVTGLELGERVRDHGYRTPIVITSGFNRQLTPGSLQQLGRARLLKKPFDLAELSHTVVSALEMDDSVEAPEGA